MKIGTMKYQHFLYRWVHHWSQATDWPFATKVKTILVFQHLASSCGRLCQQGVVSFCWKGNIIMIRQVFAVWLTIDVLKHKSDKRKNLLNSSWFISTIEDTYICKFCCSLDFFSLCLINIYLIQTNRCRWAVAMKMYMKS